MYWCTRAYSLSRQKLHLSYDAPIQECLPSADILGMGIYELPTLYASIPTDAELDEYRVPLEVCPPAHWTRFAAAKAAKLDDTKRARGRGGRGRGTGRGSDLGGRAGRRGWCRGLPADNADADATEVFEALEDPAAPAAAPSDEPPEAGAEAKAKAKAKPKSRLHARQQAKQHG